MSESDKDQQIKTTIRKKKKREKQQDKTQTSESDNRNRNPRKSNGKKSRSKNIKYAPYVPLSECLKRYAADDANIARGKLRTMPGGAIAFVACDRGKFVKDILLAGEAARNRAIDGDMVFVEIIGPAEISTTGSCDEISDRRPALEDYMSTMKLEDDVDYKAYEPAIENIDETTNGGDEITTWQDDELQVILWDPVVKVKKRSQTQGTKSPPFQYQAKVIHVIVPKNCGFIYASEINPSNKVSGSFPKRIIVGSLMKMFGDGESDRCLFVPNSRTLPRFVTPCGTKVGDKSDQLYRAEYVYGSWRDDAKWPPCVNVQMMGQSCNVEDETSALLLEHDVDHGEFSPEVLKNVDQAVFSGRITSHLGDDLGWAPTSDMYKGRRDYRSERIFTIDPTTAKDLDDALHIKKLPGGRVEIGVHIADVSAFVQPDTPVDIEAARRTTTVYLVDRVIPMLPRPLCEIACSLNENVERLAFSCVWKMNMDGTLSKKKATSSSKSSYQDDIWFGRTVIKSCARLDYATAQNIIDGKVACGEKAQDVDEKYWPKTRQPSGDHTIDAVAHDVRLMHKVAMARRKLRFENGALTLNGIKLTFQLEDDGQTPALCEPYPIRDSNRLIEEYMLLANYLVAQRLITHAGGLALLRQHSPPLQDGLQKVIDMAKEKGFDLDGTTSKSLQESLSYMGRVCEDKLFLQCVTELLMAPMRPAEYIASGEYEEEEWSHFALNIPYYTHFTSPIRRYPDILVHRLLQATLDGKQAVTSYPQSKTEIQAICLHCNDKRMASKKAQERSDRVFLSIFLKSNPILSTLGVVISIGEKAFTVYIPRIGASGMVYLEDHADIFTSRIIEVSENRREMILVPKTSHVVGLVNTEDVVESVLIQIFSRLEMSVFCKESAPIDIKLRVVGKWSGED